MDEYSETEWRGFIKFSVKFDPSPTDIIGDLKKVMGDNTPHNATIYRWIERFRAGNQGCENEARSGRPKSSRTEESVAVVQQLIKVGKIPKGNPFAQDVQVKLKPNTDLKSIRLVAFAQESGQGKLLGASMQKF